MLKGQLFIFLVICTHDSLCVTDALYDTAQELWKLQSMLIQKQELNGTTDPFIICEVLAGAGTYRDLKNQLNEVHKQLYQVEASIMPKIIRQSLKSSLLHVMIDKNMDTIEIFVLSIDEYYGEFQKYINGSIIGCPQSLRFLLGRISRNVAERVYMIRRIMVDARDLLPNSKNLVYAIVDYASALGGKLCGGPQMISNVLVLLFKSVIIAEIKAYIMLAYANILENPALATSKNSLEREDFQKQLAIYVNLFLLKMVSTDKFYMRACDPDGGIWIRDKSFYEFEGMSQVTIFQYHWAECMIESCAEVWRNKPEQCPPKYYDDRSSCSGTSAECVGLGAMQACVLKNGPYKFQYVKSTALGPLGRNFECPEDIGYRFEDGISMNSMYHTCACNCYGDHNKISLSIIRSRVENNMVITGLRFMRQDGMLYIQPRESQLSKNGYISRDSERWIPTPQFVKLSEIHPVDRYNNVFFLDNVYLPPNYVLTGVQFSKVTRGNITGFAINIIGVPFHYKSGKLILGQADVEKEIQVSPQLLKDGAGKDLSFEPINSIHTTLPHTPSPDITNYVSLKRSKLSDDFGQSTLPLFDAIPITPNPPSLLGGIGIFHKGVEGYAGFISLRVYPIEYTKYFNDFKWMHMKDGKVLFNRSQSEM